MGLDDLMAKISAREPYGDESGFCTSDGGSGFTMMFGYPDGTVTAVSGDTGGCSTIETGSGQYVGADDVLDDVVKRFTQARRGQDPPRRFSPPALDCNQDTTFDYVRSRTGRLQDATRALSCWRRNAPQPGEFHVRDVAAPDVGVLVRDALTRQIRRKDLPRNPCQGFPYFYWQDLLLATTWGDVLVLRGVCDEFLVEQSPEDGGRRTFWRPGPRAQRILNSLRQ